MVKYELQLSSELDLMSLGLIENFLKERNAVFGNGIEIFKFKFEPVYVGREMVGIAVLKEKVRDEYVKKAE